MSVKHFQPARATFLAWLAGVVLLGIPTAMSVRSVRSLEEAREAKRSGAALQEVAALDRTLQEAPPFLFPVRDAARNRLETIASGDAPPSWYATLALISASTGERRARWQRRAAELAGGRMDSLRPLVPVDRRPPSPLLAGISATALLGWVILALAGLMAGEPSFRPCLAAAAALWIVWVLTLAMA